MVCWEFNCVFDGEGTMATGRSQREFFDSRASDWETTCYPSEVRKRLAELVPEFGLKPGACVLDVGTGPGVLIPYIRRAVGPRGRICSFDLSLPMVRQARSKPLLAQDLVLQADCHRLPFADGTFDNVVCFAAFPHFDDPAIALREMARVAKPRAFLVIAHLLSREELARHHGGHDAVADDILPDAESMRAYFRQAGLQAPRIEDRPGRYLAVAEKPWVQPSEVQAGFERRAVFEKIRTADRMHHRAVREALRGIFSTRFNRPLRVLDIGCGDARDIAIVLKQLPSAEYIGIDSSREALELAHVHLAALSCTWRLIHGDYAASLQALAGPFDLIWLGLFLHHLSSEQKRDFFLRASALLSKDGLLLAHDPVLRETEDRNAFLARIAREALGWLELTAEEREMLARHWSQHGRQERIGRLEKMACQAGFSGIEILWRDPLEFYALLAFHR